MLIACRLKMGALMRTRRDEEYEKSVRRSSEFRKRTNTFLEFSMAASL